MWFLLYWGKFVLDIIFFKFSGFTKYFVCVIRCIGSQILNFILLVVFLQGILTGYIYSSLFTSYYFPQFYHAFLFKETSIENNKYVNSGKRYYEHNSNEPILELFNYVAFSYYLKIKVFFNVKVFFCLYKLFPSPPLSHQRLYVC